MDTKSVKKWSYHPHRKGSRQQPVSKSFRKRKSFSGNRFTENSKAEKQFISASAKKLTQSDDPEASLDVGFDNKFGYVILAFSLVFSHLESVLKCKKCDGDIKFLRKSVIGLGFKLEIQCSCTKPSTVDSCPRKYKTYEINRRIVLIFRLLGSGFNGLNLFCSLMDMTKNFNTHLYYTACTNIAFSAECLSKFLFQKAGREENEQNVKNGFPEGELSVSGDGSWAKRGFTSLIGICTLIGKYTGKILDCFVSSKTCKSCEVNKKSMKPEEFLIWKESEHADDCSVNYTGSSGGMEVQGVLEMFRRSENLHQSKYARYIGDGDSKTFPNLLDAKPYGDFAIEKLECVLHVGKRMFRRLKDVKKTLTEIKKLKKKQEDQAKKTDGTKNDSMEPAPKKNVEAKMTHLRLPSHLLKKRQN